MGNIYKVAIIGCGSIGAIKKDDIDYPGSPNILTHANAVSSHPRTELYAVVDTDNEKLIKTKAKWQPQMAVRSFEDIELHGGQRPDIVIVAVPTELHVDIFGNILSSQNPPKLIIAEKPFGVNLYQSQEMSKVAKNIPIMVDYIRRFAKGYQEIKSQIDKGDFGKALNCRVLYTRGLKHEGCHALDLMNYLFGKSIGYESASPFIVDRNIDDPTMMLIMSYEKCPCIIFQPCDGRLYGIFEIDICFEKCRIRFIDNGLYYEMYPISEENEWGHKSLNYRLTDVQRKETGLNIALHNLIDNAVRFLDGKAELLCTAGDAIAVHEILEGLR